MFPLGRLQLAEDRVEVASEVRRLGFDEVVLGLLTDYRPQHYCSPLPKIVHSNL